MILIEKQKKKHESEKIVIIFGSQCYLSSNRDVWKILLSVNKFFNNVNKEIKFIRYSSKKRFIMCKLNEVEIQKVITSCLFLIYVKQC